MINKKMLSVFLMSFAVFALIFSVPSSAFAVTYTKNTYIAKTSVVVRSSPSSSAKEVKTLSKGSFVERKGSSGSYLNVSFNDGSGYAQASSFVKLEEKTKYVTNCTIANIRTNSSTSSKILQKAYYTEPLKTFCQIGSWTHVETKDGKAGYVLTKYLSNTKPAKNTSLKSDKAVIKNTAPLYTHPTTTKGKFTTLKLGDKVTAYETKGKFIRVTFDGKEGFILKANLAAYVAGTKYIDNCRMTYRRAEAKVSGKALQELYYTEQLKTISKTGNYTLIEASSGKKGFVLTKYLSAAKPAKKTSLKAKKMVTGLTAPLYQYPTTQNGFKSRLKFGDELYTYEESGNFVRVVCGDKEGFVLKKNIGEYREYEPVVKYISPSTASIKIYPLNPGSTLGEWMPARQDEDYECYGTCGSFTRIKLDGEYRFIETRFLTTKKPVYEYKLVQTHARCEVLNSPALKMSSGVKVLGYIEAYETVVYHRLTNAYYTRISYKDSYGYVLTSALSLERMSTGTAPVRAAPDLNAEIIGSMYYRHTYLWLGSAHSPSENIPLGQQFEKIEFNGQIGYVKLGYLYRDYIPKAKKRTIYVSSLNANIYDLASCSDASVIGTLPCGTKLTAYEDYSSFTRISYNGKSAYIDTKNITESLL